MDLETFENNGKLIPFCLCCLISDTEYSFYYDPKEDLFLTFLKFLSSTIKENSIEIFVHNLNFDGSLIIDFLSKKKIKFTFFAKKTNLYSISIVFLNKNILFRCSYKLLGVSLTKISSLEGGLSKLNFPFKFVNESTLFYVGPVPDICFWNESISSDTLKKYSIFDLKKEAIKYCMNDVKITSLFLEKLIFIVSKESKKLINVSLSAASLSFNIFFKNYNYLKIEKNILKSYDSYIRNSYYGGRAEVIGNPKDDEHVKYFDFPGMYAQCMQEKFHNGEYRYSLDSDIYSPGFHTIRYESQSNLPILPYHDHRGKLIFSNGVKIGTFWFEEIIFFKENGGKILEVVSSLIYSKYETVFEKFVAKFISVKNLGGFYGVFGKLMINSLYGSFGLKDEEEFVYFTFSEEEFESILFNMNVSNFYKINNVYYILIKKDFKSLKFFKKDQKKNGLLRNVSYCSAIAAKARIKLYKAFKEVEKDGGRLLYCDTDSIFAAYKKNDFREFFFDKKWIDVFDDAVFISPKSYCIIKKNHQIVKIKGIKINKEYKNFYEIKDLFYSDSKIIFNNQIILNKKNFNLRQEIIRKEVWLKDYDKRIFIKNKKESVPININSTDI